ncbi:hypothetical protein [Bradyrhizobium sp.]|uniref:hypothetical protein n=1 Tax=Bradyrhizobium sp. TaxID=376 RepID=UPI002D1FBFA4|nr:hypothetical protein [Bradyrhizobium sp.]
MQSMPKLKDSNPHDAYFAIESLLHAHAEKKPHAEQAPPLAHDPAAPPAAPQVHVVPPISVGAPNTQVEPSFGAPVARDIEVRSAATPKAKPVEIKVDVLKAPDDRRTAKWVRRTFMVLLGLVGVIAAAAWQHYGDDAKAMAVEWTPPFVLAALPSTVWPASAEQPTAAATEAAATDQAAQPALAAATAPAQPDPATAAPVAESTQLQSMAQDLAAMGQQVEELKATIAQLKASQAQMARELARASETKPAEAKGAEAKAAVVALPPAVRPAAPPVRKPKPPAHSSALPYSPAPIAAAPVAPPPPVQAAAAPPPAPPRQTIADDGEPVVRPPMPLR